MSYSKSLFTNTSINSIIAGFQYGPTGPTGPTGPSLPIKYQGYGSLLLYDNLNQIVNFNEDILFDSHNTLNINGHINTSGTISSSQGSVLSDYRIKDNIKKLDDTFTVKYLNPVSYTNNKLHKTDFGLIAHELQEHFPELVTGEKDSAELQTINYIGLIPILIKEIQKLNERVEKLENK